MPGILIADDHPVLRIGLREALRDSQLTVAAEAATGKEAVRLALELELQLAVLDVSMPDGDGLSALGRIKSERPALPTAMLSAYDNPRYIARAAALGAGAYLLKSQPSRVLVESLSRVAAGETLWTGDELRRVSGAGVTAPCVSGDVELPLTQRENEVLRQLTRGLTNKEIAQALNISYETVKEHVQHILRKVGVSDRTQAAVWAVRKGLA